jgi:uncharacterized membrane protein
MSRPPTLNVFVLFWVPMPEVGVVGLLRAVGTVRTLPLGHVYITTRVSVHTKVIIIREVSFGNTYAGSALEVIMWRDSALY